MRPHLRYLRYVLLHKWYVFIGGLLIHGWRVSKPGWVWSLLIHDLSKFRPSEWRPYVATFYAGAPKDRAEMAQRSRAFDAAWLKHQHRNPHHWQHWVLREDTGATKILVPPVDDVDEMIADWLGAGTTILRYPSLAVCVHETLRWYLDNRERIQLRDVTRQRVETILIAIAVDYKEGAMVDAIVAAQARTVRFTITPPQHGGLAPVET